MKTKLICWLPKSFYQHDIKCVELLIENNIVPMLDDADTVAIWEAQGKPEWAMREVSYVPAVDNEYDYQIPAYKDEPVSTGQYTVTNSGFKLLCSAKNITIGETSLETISQLVDAGCKSITYTCYGWHLFRIPILNLNIWMPFTTQLNTWKKLEKLYGGYCSLSELDRKLHPDWAFAIKPSKFTFCWIMLDQTKSFKKLIQWCIAHNKTIGLVAPDSKQNNPEWVKEHLELFINAYKEVVK